MKLTISLITHSAIIYFYIYHQQSQLGAFFSVVHYFLSSLCCVLMHKKNEVTVYLRSSLNATILTFFFGVTLAATLLGTPVQLLVKARI